MFPFNKMFRRRVQLQNSHAVAARRRIAIGASVVVATAAVCAAAIPQAAYAGTNGQQIRFDLDHCGGGLGSVSVYGTNQYGQSVQWVGRAANDAVSIPGWWWVGNITVNYTQGGLSRSVHAYVPQGNDTSYQYWPNVVRVDCHGSWKFGSSRVLANSGYQAMCMSVDNPFGSYTRYYNAAGYWGEGWNHTTQWYSIAYTGTVPGLVTTSYYSIVCG